MIQLTQEDLEALAAYFPDLDLTDEQRREVLLCSSSVDIQAAPGSGKTTLLAIKLALLASKWGEKKRGICILSHTNVARLEIENRLAKIPGGIELLRYPHFVGTIQTFIHTFLALPLLRSSAIRVEFVDNDRFTKRAVSLGQTKYEIKSWLSVPNLSRLKALNTLRFEGSTLSLGCAEGELPKSGKTRPVLEKLKQSIACEGLFRYDDMFAFALHTVSNWPSVSRQLSHRFPLVFVDEMQDTDSLADKTLMEVFDETVVVQRFGDVNQSIISRSGQGAKTFPVHPYLNVSGSMRFGRDFANIVSKLRLEGPVITGQGHDALAPVTFLAYSDESILSVIPHFGEFVAELSNAAELNKGAVKVVCARRKPMENPRIGCSLGEYWPAYVHAETVPQPTKQSIAQLLESALFKSDDTIQLTSRIHAVQVALIRLLRLAGVTELVDLQNWRQLEMFWGREHQGLISLRNLALNWVVSTKVFGQEELEAFIQCFCSELSKWLNPLITPAVLLAEDELKFDSASMSAGAGSNQRNNVHLVTSNGNNFPVEICTIASVKGETHFATLVLESFNKYTFDISAVLPLLCGQKKLSDFEDEISQSHIKNLFVATSRPKKILCLAVHRDRLIKYEKEIKALGWQIRHV